MSKQGKPWSDVDIKYLLNRFNITPISLLSRRLERSESAVTTKFRTMTYTPKKVNRTGLRWSAAELDLLRTNRGLPIHQLAEKIGRSEAAVHTKCNELFGS